MAFSSKFLLPSPYTYGVYTSLEKLAWGAWGALDAGRGGGIRSNMEQDCLLFDANIWKNISSISPLLPFLASKSIQNSPAPDAKKLCVHGSPVYGDSLEVGSNKSATSYQTGINRSVITCKLTQKWIWALYFSDYDDLA
ncbi:hypothetical protein NIES4071_17720 [Calothrix sp. NIES-4071]|nr:hypothetical protein NIES4071_17720 [Calothrix sp. NIES-4071]BAZ56105.1 hypothetical protein NIES4105_17670 [Calothrix sp. NIES-4105]